MEKTFYETSTFYNNLFNTIRLPWSRFKDIRPPFPLIKKPDDLIITFDVNFTTQILTKFRKSKRFEDIHNLINQFHEEGMSNMDIFKLSQFP